MQIHGHEIIDLITKHPEGILADTLTEIAANKFGAETRFFTCSAENMSLPELLTFLVERGKVQLCGEQFFSGNSPACTHH